MKDIVDKLQDSLEYEFNLSFNERKQLLEEIERLNNIINESRRILGEYKHYSSPDESQNSFNEEIVDKAYINLHSNLEEKGSDKE